MRITFHLGEDEVSRFEIASHVGGATPGVPRPEGGAAQPRSGAASADTSWDWRARGRGRMPRGVPASLRGTAGRAVKAQTPGRGRREEGRGRGGRGGGGGAACAPPRSAASVPSSVRACGRRHLRQHHRPPPDARLPTPSLPGLFPRAAAHEGGARRERGGRQLARPPASHPRRAGAGRPSPAGRRRWACGARWPPLPTSTPATCATSCRRGVSTAPSCNRHHHRRRRRCAAPARLPLGAR